MNPDSLPSEMVLVPREPTKAMVDAGANEWERHNRGSPYDDEIPAIYAAMLAAHPSAAPQGAQPVQEPVAEHCMCKFCKDGAIHASDCSVHNEPALPIKPCDCHLAHLQPAAWQDPNCPREIQNALWACVVALERPESSLPEGHKLAVAKDARICIVALDEPLRFFMDHGVWHDRETGQHLYTDDQHAAAFNEVWQALEEAGIERSGWISIPDAIKKLATPKAEQPDSSYSTSRVGQINKTALPRWEPIETAPKDGAWVLLFCPHGQYVAFWQREDLQWWHVDDNKHGPYALRGASPTHWMPLPLPPGESAGSARSDEKASAPESSVSVPKEQQAIEVLTQLVRLKALKDLLDAHDYCTTEEQYFAARADYLKNKPLAWDRARSLVAGSTADSAEGKQHG